CRGFVSLFVLPRECWLGQPNASVGLSCVVLCLFAPHSTTYHTSNVRMSHPHRDKHTAIVWAANAETGRKLQESHATRTI
ncbi:hypothetical protein BCR44DRAFT_1449308, partial [Catenaria anguillulae PL171]